MSINISEQRGSSSTGSLEVQRRSSIRAASMLRQLMESIVFLTCAVVLFRAFAAEGYMISTGSMAPSLLGYHRRVTCTSCEYEFAHGASAGQSTSVTASAQAEVLGHLAEATCPNCGQGAVETHRYPRNEGDQLLVHKHAYAFRSPRRWETVVFRNPSNPVEAYVKRIGGLPGEEIEIRRGDVIADGVLQRKSLLSQRSMRVLVYDDSFRPQDDSWRPRWEVGERVSEQNGRYDFESIAGFDAELGLDWQLSDGGPSDDRQRGLDDEWRWTTYRHWLLSGGAHQSSVRIANWPADATTVAPEWPQLRYDAAAGKLIAQGVMDASWHHRLRHCSADAEFVAAIDRLEAKSHQSPIVDHYGYNRDTTKRVSYAVRDLMWSGRVRAEGGRIRIQMMYGRQPFFGTIDVDQQTVSISTLGPGGREDLLATGPLTADLATDTGALVEMSLFDRQVLFAINGLESLPPVPFSVTDLAERRSRTPVRFGVQNVPQGKRISVAAVRLYRDVYVTPKGETDGAFRVDDGEYFVLGDNSPVSVDSRVWDNPAVSHTALIGKPFLVHLPSKQRQLQWNGQSRHVRLPDWDRVRYVR